MDLLPLHEFPAVPATGIATLVTDQLRGYSVHAMFWELGGTAYTKAMMTDVTVKCGKDLLTGITGTQVQSYNSYRGTTSNAAYLAHYFGDPTARTIRGQHLGDLDLSVYSDPLTIRVTNAGATSPTLRCWALVGPPKAAMGIGFDQADVLQTRALLRTVIQTNAAVTRKSFGIGLGSEAGARLRSIAFFHANLTSVQFKKASTEKWEDVSVALNTFVQEEYARSPAASLYVLDRVFDGNAGEAEPTLQKDGRPWPFQVNLTLSAGDTIDAYADVHAAIPLL